MFAAPGRPPSHLEKFYCYMIFGKGDLIWAQVQQYHRISSSQLYFRHDGPDRSDGWKSSCGFRLEYRANNLANISAFSLEENMFQEMILTTDPKIITAIGIRKRNQVDVAISCCRKQLTFQSIEIIYVRYRNYFGGLKCFVVWRHFKTLEGHCLSGGNTVQDL